MYVHSIYHSIIVLRNAEFDNAEIEAYMLGLKVIIGAFFAEYIIATLLEAI